MQSKKKTHLAQRSRPVERGKIVIITLLSVTAFAIAASGAFFSVYSLVNQISFKVINTQVSGVIFGICVLYLGIRYLISLQRLKTELYKTTSTFSWSNFKRSKAGVGKAAGR